MSKWQSVIAIDGPSGAGKSTLAKKLAQSLNVLYIDTGAIFRALSAVAAERNVCFEEGVEIKIFLDSLNITYGTSATVLISIDGVDLTSKIREHSVSKLASHFSQIISVREFVLNFERKLAENKICVMEGRDIGTIVFPKAFCKFFITASVDTRAKRRLEQLKYQGERLSDLDLEQVKSDVIKRDREDRERPIAPLKEAEDAYIIDTTYLELDEVLRLLTKEVQQKAIATGLHIKN